MKLTCTYYIVTSKPENCNVSSVFSNDEFYRWRLRKHWVAVVFCDNQLGIANHVVKTRYPITMCVPAVYGDVNITWLRNFMKW